MGIQYSYGGKIRRYHACFSRKTHQGFRLSTCIKSKEDQFIALTLETILQLTVYRFLERFPPPPSRKGISSCWRGFKISLENKTPQSAAFVSNYDLLIFPTSSHQWSPIYPNMSLTYITETPCSSSTVIYCRYKIWRKTFQQAQSAIPYSAIQAVI